MNKKKLEVFSFKLGVVIIFLSLGLIVIWGLFSIEFTGRTSGDCRENSDPLGLANGKNILFVDPDNCNCNDSGTREDALNSSTPLCTPLGLSTTAEDNGDIWILDSNDTVYFREADYNLELNSYRNDPNVVRKIILRNYEHTLYDRSNLTLAGYPGEEVSIEIGNNCTEDCGFSFSSSGINNLTIKNLNFIGHLEKEEGVLDSRHLVELTSMDGLSIINSSFRDNQHKNHIYHEEMGNPTWSRSLELRGISNLLLDGVDVRCTGNLEGNYSHIIAGKGFYLDSVEDGIVRNSGFYDCGHQAITIIGNSSNLLFENNEFNNRFHTCLGLQVTDNLTIRNNDFHDWTTIKHYDKSGSGTEEGYDGAAIQMSNVTNTRIYNNLFYDAGYDARGILFSIDENMSVKNVDIINNLFYNIGNASEIHHTPLAVYSKEKEDRIVPAISNLRIYNNIFNGILNPADGENEIKIVFWNFFNSSNHGVEIKNNLIGTSGTTKTISLVNWKTIYESEESGEYDYNVEEFNENFVFVSGNFYGTPGFANPGGGNFRHLEEDPTIDKGLEVDYINEDYYGNSRLDGNGVDLGPFESYFVARTPVESPSESSGGGGGGGGSSTSKVQVNDFSEEIPEIGNNNSEEEIVLIEEDEIISNSYEKSLNLNSVLIVASIILFLLIIFIIFQIVRISSKRGKIL